MAEVKNGMRRHEASKTELLEGVCSFFYYTQDGVTG